jgi:AcrR family transcriptional regulator
VLHEPHPMGRCPRPPYAHVASRAPALARARRAEPARAPACCDRRGDRRTRLRADAGGRALRLSGISRTTFYQHFPGGKEECFLATVDAAMAVAVDAVSDACEADRGDRLERAFAAIGQTVAEHPAAARLCLIDAYAPGESGLARVDEALTRFAWRLTQALGQSPERAAAPPVVANGIVRASARCSPRGSSPARPARPPAPPRRSTKCTWHELPPEVAIRLPA